MRRCIIHFGLLKTGTSSIQEALYSSDLGPGDTYLHYDTPYIGRQLMTAFCRPPWRLVSDLRDVSKARRESAVRGFQRLVNRATGNRLILSAEDLSQFEEEELADLLQCLKSAGLAIEAVAYIREYRGWCESLFQQKMKNGIGPPTLFPLGPDAYRFAVEKFDRLLGRENVRLWKYDRSRFPHGCVVHDFFNRLHVAAEPVVKGDVNRGLCLEAVKLLRAFHLSNLRPVGDTPSMIRTYWLANHLRSMQGTPLRFHRTLFEDRMRRECADLDWIEQRLGESVREESREEPSGEAIRHVEDLDDFSTESLEWLSRESGVVVDRTNDRRHLSIRVARAMAALQDTIVANPQTRDAPHVSRTRSSKSAWVAACWDSVRAMRGAEGRGDARAISPPSGDRQAKSGSGVVTGSSQGVVPKIIWAFWGQGRENAPWIVRRCLDSWQEMNPQWTLRVLDAAEAEPYLRRAAIPWRRIEAMRIDQKSAVLRMRVLSEVGGVWTDATNYCLNPLDDWLPECMGGGLFAFRDICPFVMVSNWFLSASGGSRLAILWRDELESFWASRDYIPHSSYPGQAAPELPRLQRALLQLFHRFFDRNTRTTDLWFHPAVRLVFRSYPYCVMLYLFSRGYRNDPEWRSLASRMGYRPAKPILLPYTLVEEGKTFDEIVDIGRNLGLPLMKFNWKRPPLRGISPADPRLSA